MITVHAPTIVARIQADPRSAAVVAILLPMLICGSRIHAGASASFGPSSAMATLAAQLCSTHGRTSSVPGIVLLPALVETDEPPNCDVLVVGGGTGGTAAAIAACEAGARVLMLVEGDWLGGQMTEQGVSVLDEHRFIESFGGTRRYYAFREAVRHYYRTHYRLASRSTDDAGFNPGNCWAGGLSFEPCVGALVLRQAVGRLEATGRLQVLFRTRATACRMDDETRSRIVAVQVRRADGATFDVRARYVLDATDTGEVLALCGTEGEDWVAGAESRLETGEPDAPEEAHPGWVQNLTLPIAVDWSPGTKTTNVISPPPDYARLKAEQGYGIHQGAITGLFRGRWPWWTYRRALAAENFADPGIRSDLTLINTPSNDYRGGASLVGGSDSPAGAEVTLMCARNVSRGYVYWLQTECPREDDPSGKQRGYPELRVRHDVFDTPDGCSRAPYIRESRRIRSLRTIREQDVVVRDQSGHPWQTGARAAFMPDSIGVGYYPLDIHSGGAGEASLFLPTRPFQIPLGAFMPIRITNLLPAAKDLGTTHLTNGAYRLHPVEWNIGESAGLLAAFCAQTGRLPREINEDRSLLFEFQAVLIRSGVPLCWYIDVPLKHPAFEAVQRLAVRGLPLGCTGDLLFHPDTPITISVWRAWCTAAGLTAMPSFIGTRAAAATTLDAHLRRSETEPSLNISSAIRSYLPGGAHGPCRITAGESVRRRRAPACEVFLPRPLREAYESAPSGHVRAALVRLARFDGWAYELGQKGYGRQRSIDCSGLVGQAYPALAGRPGAEWGACKQFDAQTDHGRRILKRGQLLPGDLIYFRPIPAAIQAAKAHGRRAHFHIGVVLANDHGAIRFYNAHVHGGVSVSILPKGVDQFGPTLVFAGGGRAPSF